MISVNNYHMVGADPGGWKNKVQCVEVRWEGCGQLGQVPVWVCGEPCVLLPPLTRLHVFAAEPGQLQAAASSDVPPGSRLWPRASHRLAPDL